jgi:putative addiction module CopG family antidote
MLEVMPTQNVNLTPQLDRFVKKIVKNGEFNSASEVHRAALSAMVREREERALRIARLCQEVQLGLDSGSPKKISDIDLFLEECADEALKDLPTGA